ncbi:hypothetical protein PR202_gb24025 [Eleusine coracana subsp. coracana]|uniref:Uncharacterized protein n=1 Tax=Eleusine coracana subsp. coracana TaxID=191504 RepID=A0AAV5FKL3_ELECO|nr:hypothetical protein PR202_gb24025 [Eleusine coracana subsp. coracana]
MEADKRTVDESSAVTFRCRRRSWRRMTAGLCSVLAAVRWPHEAEPLLPAWLCLAVLAAQNCLPAPTSRNELRNRGKRKFPKQGGQESMTGLRIRRRPRPPPPASQCGNKGSTSGRARGERQQPSLDKEHLVGFGGWIWALGFGGLVCRRRQPRRTSRGAKPPGTGPGQHRKG